MNKLKVMYLNARSIKNKMEDIEILIFGENIEIIVITETWVNKGEEKYYKFKNFNSIWACRRRRGGGLGIFVKNNIEIELMETVENEIFFLSLKLKQYDIIISGIYRPPAIKSDILLTFLDEKLENFADSKLECYLLGDMNVDILQSDTQAKRIMDIYLTNSFKILNSSIPTRDATNSKSLIDHIISNSSKDITLNLKTSQISDHKIQIFEIPLICKKKYQDIKQLNSKILM